MRQLVKRTRTRRQLLLGATSLAIAMAAIVGLASMASGVEVGATVFTFAGTGTAGSAAASASTSTATFAGPVGGAVDASGNVFIAEHDNNVVRKIAPAGTVIRFAGSGTNGHADGASQTATFRQPVDLAIDAAHNLYVLDAGAQGAGTGGGIRKVTSTGTVTTVAGSSATNSAAGSADGVGTAASFREAYAMCIDASGTNLYVADSLNNKIRKVVIATGRVTTYAGGAGQATAGHNNGATSTAQFNLPSGIAIDASSNVYVSDRGSNYIRKITPAGVVSDYAGTGTAGGSDGATSSATFNTPYGMEMDSDGILYVAEGADAQTHVGGNDLRAITPEGQVYRVAGSTSGVQGSVDGTGTNVLFTDPRGVFFDSQGNLYIGEHGNTGGAGSKVRKVECRWKYAITSSSGAGGAISPLGKTMVGAGNSATFNATPDTGYHMTDLRVDGKPVTLAPSYTFNNVRGDHTISATYAINMYRINYFAGSDGQIAPALWASQSVPYGGATNFVLAVPSDHHHFTQWSDGGTSAMRHDALVTADATYTASFAIDTNKVDYKAGSGGTITGEASQTVDYGSDASTVTAVPDEGHHFVKWSDDSTANPRTDTNVTAPIDVTAEFAVDTFSITVAPSTNGTITPPGDQLVDWGTDKTFDVVPDAHYHIDTVYVDGDSIGASSSVTFEDIKKAHTLSATFAIDTNKVDYKAGSGGTITGEASQTVDYGSSASTVTAVPDEGHHFVKWSDDSTANPRTDTNVTAPIDVTAEFAVDTFSITVAPSTNGTITPPGDQLVDWGTDKTFDVVPDAHYHIDTVYVDGDSIGASASVTFEDIKKAHTLSATFAIDTYNFDVTAGANGGITPFTGSRDLPWGTDVTFTVTPSTGYHIASLAVDGVFVTPTGTVVFTGIDSTHSVAAQFAIDTFTLEYQDGAHGVVEGGSSQNVWYGHDGDPVSVVAQDGYHFVQWSDGITANPRTDTDVKADINVTAEYAINTYQLHYSAGENGLLTGDASQTVDYGGSGSAVTATASAGFHFLQWSDGSTANPRTDANVRSDIAVTALFQADSQKPVDRLAGTNRYATAVASAKDLYPNWSGVRYLVLASGDSRHLPDALTAAGLAGVYNAPLLLVPKNYLDDSTAAAIKAMPKGLRVYVVGGAPAVSNGVLSKIKRISKVRTVTRVSGTDRYGTGAAVARRMRSVLGSRFPQTAIFTNGERQALLLDPLAASTVSVTRHYPVMLVQTNGVPKSTAKAASDLRLSDRYLLGNASEVSENVRTHLGIPAERRICGADVNGDAVAFAQFAKAQGWLGNAYVGFAAALPDAATGGVYMGRRNGPIVMVTRDTVPAVTANYLSAIKGGIVEGYVFGGPPAVTNAVQTQLQGYIN